MADLLYVRGASADVAVDDLGITVAQGPSWTQLMASSPGDADGSSGQFTAREIRDSADLTAAITGGSLEWSRDGAVAESGGDYVADYVLLQDFTDDIFDMSNGGLVLPQDTSLPASGVSGQAFWDTDDTNLYIWDGSQWQTIAVGEQDHGDLSGLDDDDHPQYLLLDGDGTRNTVSGVIDMSSGDEFILPQSTDVSLNLTGHEGALAWDTDDEVLYAHDGTQWFAIAPASGIITDHGGLTGLGDDDHTQYLNETRHDALPADNPHSVTFTQAVSADTGTDITAAEAETLTDGSNADLLHVHDYAPSVHTHDHGADLTGLEDDDHPQYTEWNDTETVSGLWTFDGPADSPSFVLDPETSAPSSNLTDGAISYINDVLYVYDGTRGKWLSVDRVSYTAARNKRNSSNIYMRVSDGVPTSVTGIRMLRDGTITGIFAQTEGAESWTFEVRRAGSVIASLVISAATGGQDTTIDVDVSQGDEIQFYCNGTGIAYPVGGIEVAWRE